MLVHDYRRCNNRRQGAVRTFASKLAGLYAPGPQAAPQNVIDLLKYRR